MPYFIGNLLPLSFNENNELSVTWQGLLTSVKRLSHNRLYNDLTSPSPVSTLAAYNSDSKRDVVLLMPCAHRNKVPLSQMAAGRVEVKISSFRIKASPRNGRLLSLSPVRRPHQMAPTPWLCPCRLLGLLLHDWFENLEAQEVFQGLCVSVFPLFFNLFFPPSTVEFF